jgi:two-component system sensor histidine kinase YesM
VDQQGNNIVNYSANESEIVSSFPEELSGNKKAVCKAVDYKGEEYLCTFTTIKTNDWKLYSVKSKYDLLGNLASLRKFIVLILILGVIISVIVTVLLAISITTPINHLVRIMRRADQQDFHVKFQYPYKNEVGNLADGFNYMIGEIDHLISELNVSIEALKEEKENVKNVQKQKRLAELKALQAQINPHFLYNTLNAITWQAADQGASEISILSNSLGKFFRLSLSNGNEIITLKDEIEHVRSYLNIQRIRYKTKLNYEIEVEEELLGIPTIKLILQPLVENSIYHGIKLKDSEGLIRIYSSKHIGENGILVVKLCVEDNGYGIEEDKLLSINSGLMEGKNHQKEGYGIYNVNERIKLYYGEDYGLMFESKFGEWTRATIIIPAQIIV